MAIVITMAGKAISTECEKLVSCVLTSKKLFFIVHNESIQCMLKDQDADT